MKTIEKKIIGIVSAAVVLMAMLTACGIGVFECDLCGETKAGVKNEAGMFGKTIVSMLPVAKYPIFGFVADIVNSRYLLMLLVQTALFTAMYAALPNRKNPAGECVPGAVLASIGWQGFSAVFSLYVDNFRAYSNIYGSVYAVALCMLWLYFCMYIIFLGGAFNRFLAWYRKEKK